MKPPPKLPLLLDGDGSFSVEDCPGLWALDHPEAVVEAQKRRLLAGCDVFVAPTGGLSRERLAARGFEDRVAELNGEAVRRTRAVVGDGRVAGCILADPPVSEESDLPARRESSYREQAQALCDAGVDLLLCARMPTLTEARAALLAVRPLDLPVFVTLEVGTGEDSLSDPPLLPAVVVLQSLGVCGVGLSGAVPPSALVEPIMEALPYAEVPLIAMPGSGDGKAALSPLRFAEGMEDLLDAGASIVGCQEGGSAEHLAVVRGVIDRHPTVAPREIDTDAVAVEREALFLSEDLEVGDPLPCDSDLADRLIEAEETGNAALLLIAGPGDVDNLVEFGGMSRLPIILHADHAVLLDDALRRFPGRLLVDTLCEIDRPLLEDIAARYGAMLY